jgi:hypothetical protein
LLMFGLGGLDARGLPFAPILADATANVPIATVIALLVVGGLGALWLYRPQWPWALLAAVVLVPILAIPRAMRTSATSDLSVANPPLGRIAAVNLPWGLQTAAPALLPPNTGSLSSIREIGGYDSLLHRETVETLRDIDNQDPAPEANGNMMFVKPTADPAALAEAGVEQIWSRVELQGFGRPFSTENGVLRYRVNGLGRASTPQGSAEITSETASGLRLEATGPGTLTVRDRMMPGWTATVDGKEVPMRGQRWRELDLPEGPHVVEMRYTPPGLLTGLYLGLPAWLLVGVSGLIWRRRDPAKTP